MIKEKLDELKKKLDQLIESGASKDEIYEMSVQIDKLLIEYYHEDALGEMVK